MTITPTADAIGLFVNAQNFTIPSGLDRVRTSGFGQPGMGAAAYLFDPAVNAAFVAAHPRAAFLDANGRGFRLDPEQELTVQMFGGKADSNGSSGTDILPALNAATNYLLHLSVNHDGVSRGATALRIPAGAYYQNGTFDPKGITFRLYGDGHGKDGGKPTVIHVNNADAIRIQRHNTQGVTSAPSTRGSDGFVIEGLRFECINGVKGAAASGLRARARFTLRDCFFHGFPEDGVNIIAAAGEGGQFEGNVNCFHIENVSCISNGKNGFHISGPDVNAGIVIGCDASFNGRWGFLERSFLGNTYTGCHASDNGLANVAYNGPNESHFVTFGGVQYYVLAGQESAAANVPPGTAGSAGIWVPLRGGGATRGIPTWASGMPVVSGGPYRGEDPNAANLFLGCYAESGQGASQAVSPTMFVGGFHGETDVIGGAVWHRNRLGVETSNNGYLVQLGERESFFGAYNKFINLVHHTKAPLGWQITDSSTDLRLAYSDADANESWRILGPLTHNPAGPHTFLTNRLAIGIGFDNVRIAAQPSAPSGQVGVMPASSAPSNVGSSSSR